MRKASVFSEATAVLVFSMTCALLGCGIFGEDDDFSPWGAANMRPSVRLEAIPPVGDTTRYVLDLNWTAWDDDGEIDHFLYSVDPPDTAGADTAWVMTDAYSATITFSTDAYDTTTIDEFSDWKRSQIAVGYHEFVIVAVDDQGGVSAPDYLAFNASTICPVSHITSPPPMTTEATYQGVGQSVGTRVTFRWEGEDPDGVFNKKPVGYLCKLTELDEGWTNWKDVPNFLYYDQEPWVEVGPDTTRITLDLEDGRCYGFGVRAIDEAGAVEPLLVLNRNLLWVCARESSSHPLITVGSTAFGSRSWLGMTIDPETYEVPRGSAYELGVSADAGWYGGLITGYSYAWDLTDLESTQTHPEGSGAWTPWSSALLTIAARFSDPWDRYLYIRCKDDQDVTSLAVIRFAVVSLSATKNLGYIDDWRFYPRTGAMGETLDDQFWQGMLSGYDNGNGWADLAWDEWDAPNGEGVPTLQFLSQFKVIVWSIGDRREIAPDDKSAWYRMNFINTAHPLAVYLGSENQSGEKGKLWVFGSGMVESCVLPYGGTLCEYPFAVRQAAPLTSCSIRARSFAYDFLHIRGDYSSADRSGGGARVNLYADSNEHMDYVYVNADDLPMPGYGLPPAAVLYPELPPRLEPDLTKYRANTMLSFEVLEYPGPDQERQYLFFDPWLGRRTGLIPLYRYDALDQSSKVNGKYCGFRYMPQNAYDHGQIVYFFFPMYPMYDSQARATAKVVLSDWFGLPYPGAAVGR